MAQKDLPSGEARWFAQTCVPEMERKVWRKRACNPGHSCAPWWQSRGRASVSLWPACSSWHSSAGRPGTLICVFLWLVLICLGHIGQIPGLLGTDPLSSLNPFSFFFFPQCHLAQSQKDSVCLAKHLVELE